MAGLLLSEVLHALSQLGIAQRQNGRGHQSRVSRPGFADTHGGHRHSRWHLHDGQQGIQAIQVAGTHWHTDDGQYRLAAPAIMTCKPRSRALSAYSISRSGVR